MGHIDIPDVLVETVCDMLRDIEYRREDTNVIDTHDIAGVAASADVGCYPLKNRDVVTPRSWQAEDEYHTVINFSVKHPASEEGLLKKPRKACVKYPAWKQQHDTNMNWLQPEQKQLPLLALSELALQCAASLENIDEG
ncbi:LOW QUALITY PROTEIN: START domain-containing protein 10-like [Cariama cristata]